MSRRWRGRRSAISFSTVERTDARLTGRCPDRGFEPAARRELTPKGVFTGHDLSDRLNDHTQLSGKAMKLHIPVSVLMACIAAVVSMSSLAALHGRLPATEGGTDYQAYYDDVQNITWIADGRLAASNTFGLPAGEWLGPHPDDSADPAYSNGRIDA